MSLGSLCWLYFISLLLDFKCISSLDSLIFHKYVLVLSVWENVWHCVMSETWVSPITGLQTYQTAVSDPVWKKMQVSDLGYPKCCLVACWQQHILLLVPKIQKAYQRREKSIKKLDSKDRWLSFCPFFSTDYKNCSTQICASSFLNPSWKMQFGVICMSWQKRWYQIQLSLILWWDMT